MIVLEIARNDLHRLFITPVAWVILAVVQFLLSIFLFILLSQYLATPEIYSGRGLTEIVAAGMLQVAGVILLLVTPFLSMRMFCEDERSGTIKLLLSAPVSTTELVLGKYLSLLTFFICMLLMIALMPLSLFLGSQPDLGQLLAGLLGLLLLVCAFTGVGLFISTLTRQPVIAAVITFAVLFLFWIIHVAANTQNENLAEIFSYLSMLKHYEYMVYGMFSSEDAVYYLLVSILFIVLSIWRLDAKRTIY